MDEDEFRYKVAQSIARGGWSLIVAIVDLVPIQDLRDAFSHLDEDDD